MYNEKSKLEYKSPNKDLIYVDYWKYYIKENIK